MAHNLRNIMQKIGFGGIYRCSTSNTMKTSHLELQPILENMKTMQDFDNHDLIALQYHETTDTIFSAFVHRTYRGQSQGGLRLHAYPNDNDLLFDGLRLSSGMSYKNALAGLWWGGGKGIINKPLQPFCRESLFRDYGKFISKLQGVYVTAEDVGTTTLDTKAVLSETRFVTCIPIENGGSGNPSKMTAQGVVSALKVGLENQNRTISDVKIAIQGAGNVSYHIIDNLIDEKVRQLIVTDPDPKRLDAISTLYNNKRYPGKEIKLSLYNSNVLDFESLDVDVLMPCALGGTINKSTIPTIRASLICGAANNQLLESSDDKLLKEHNITYLPDYVINRMGIVNCCNEQYGSLKNDPMKDHHYDPLYQNSIPSMIQTILENSQRTDTGTAEVANQLAYKFVMEPNPIYGFSRCQEIIKEVFQK